ncbi:MAG: 3'-5' exonuclease [Pseudomonadota bacterium]
MTRRQTRRAVFVRAPQCLKERGIAVAGVDRLVLTSHIAVLDLLALGKCLLNPHDELSLAATLKSPLFGLDDDDIMHLCLDRGSQTLLSRLQVSELKNHRDAALELQALGKRAHNCTAFEFYADLLSARGGREKLAARLNPETADVLDEFLAAASAFEREQGGSLFMFIDHLERLAPEVKREMEQDADAVRIMTVHGAKGLEAPVVFLVDDCTAPHNASMSDPFVILPTEILAPGINHDLPAWSRSKPRSSIMEAMAERKRLADEEEYRRLLYVGMTRAADVLYIVGHTTKPEPPKPEDLRWHSMVWGALEGASDVREEDHGHVLVFPAGSQMASPRAEAKDTKSASTSDTTRQRVQALRGYAPQEPPAKRPLIPSGATSFAITALRPEETNDDAHVPSLLERPPSSATVGMASSARGTALHTLLQMLPDVSPDQRDALARRWLDKNGFPDATHRALIDEVNAVLTNPAYARLFRKGSRAEVQIMGTVMVKGEERGVSGVIDRLVVGNDTVTILDYKTGRAPANGVAPNVAVYQLALYGALVEKLYPKRRIETLLIYTRVPLIVDVPTSAREKALADLAQV